MGIFIVKNKVKFRIIEDNDLYVLQYKTTFFPLWRTVGFRSEMVAGKVWYHPFKQSRAWDVLSTLESVQTLLTETKAYMIKRGYSVLPRVIYEEK